MYALSPCPQAEGIHIRQITSAYVTCYMLQLLHNTFIAIVTTPVGQMPCTSIVTLV